MNLTRSRFFSTQFLTSGVRFPVDKLFGLPAVSFLDHYPVPYVWAHRDLLLVILTVDSETVETTPEHPFYTAEGVWVAAAELQAGDRVRRADDSYGTVQAVAIVYRPQVHFNAAGQHEYTLEPGGRKTAYTYNADGTVATMGVVMPGEMSPRWTWTFAYQDGRLAMIADPAGRVTTFTVDAHNHLTQIEGADGATRSYAYDQDGLITQFTAENGAVASYSFDTYGRLSGVQEPLRASYDPATGKTTYLRETRVLTPSDTAYTLINDSPVGAPGDPAPAVPLSASLVDRVDYGRGYRQGHTNEWGNWLDETDALGRTAAYTRTADNNIAQLTTPGGSCVKATYDQNGNPLTQEYMGSEWCSDLDPDDSQIHKQQFTYEPRFNKVKTQTDALERTTTYVYDYELDLGEAGNLVRVEYPPVQDENGVWVTPTAVYTYNAWGLLAEERDARGTVTRYVYTNEDDDDLFKPGVTPVPGLLTQVIRDDGGLNLTTTYRDFDALGYAETVIYPGSNNVVHYLYDLLGRTISETNAAGVTTRYEYDAGTLSRRTTGDGAQALVTGYGYDGQNRLIYERTVADGGEVQTAYLYDINGQLARQEDGAGHPNGRAYDLADQLTQQTDAAGNAVSYAYDGNGRQTIVTDTNGIATRTEYDAWDRVSRTVANWEDGIFDPAEPDRDIVTRYAYDKVGNTIIVTDTGRSGTNASRMTRTWYDAGERVLGTIANWDGATTLEGCAALPPERDENLCTLYAYDVAGNTLIVTNTLGRMTRTFYDALGRTAATVANWNPATLASPADCVLSPENDAVENICTLYGYDAAGNQVTTTNALNQTTLTVYDDANRPFISVANWDGTPIVVAGDCYSSLQPDVNLCTITYYDALGRRESTRDPLDNPTEFGYDARGRLITTTRYLGDGAAVTTSQYDILGNLVAETDANGRTTRYIYDELNRLVQTISAEGVETGQAYNAGGQVVTTTDGLGRATVNAYDALGRLASVTDAEGNVTRYEYDGLGNQVQITNPKSQITRYEYDSLNRLVAVIENYQPTQPPDHQTNVRTQYVYDILGSRLVITNAGVRVRTQATPRPVPPTMCWGGPWSSKTH